jgi:hypothetical protein
MANILFLSPKLSDAATTIFTASTQVTALPVTNLQNQEPTKKWRSTGAVAENVVMDFGAVPIAANALCLVGGNLSGNGQFRVRGATSQANLTAAPSVDSAMASAWPASGSPAGSDFPIAHFIHLRQWTNTTAYRWWRVDFADSTPVTSYWEFGRLMLGVSFQPTLNLDLEAAVGWDPTDVQEPSPYGQIFTDPRPYTRRRFDIPFSAMDADEVHATMFNFAKRGTAGDIAVFLDPAATTRFHWWSMQGLFMQGLNFKGVPYFNNGLQMFGTAFSIVEKL